MADRTYRRRRLAGHDLLIQVDAISGGDPRSRAMCMTCGARGVDLDNPSPCPGRVSPPCP